MMTIKDKDLAVLMEHLAIGVRQLRDMKGLALGLSVDGEDLRAAALAALVFLGKDVVKPFDEVHFGFDVSFPPVGKY